MFIKGFQGMEKMLTLYNPRKLTKRANNVKVLFCFPAGKFWYAD